jgi:hypothetical protein
MLDGDKALIDELEDAMNQRSAGSIKIRCRSLLASPSREWSTNRIDDSDRWLTRVLSLDSTQAYLKVHRVSVTVLATR